MKRSQCCSKSFSASGSSPWSSIFAIDSAIASYLWRNNTITNYLGTTKNDLNENPSHFLSKHDIIPCHIISSKHPKILDFLISLAPGHHIHGEVFLLQWSLFSILRLQGQKVETSQHRIFTHPGNEDRLGKLTKEKNLPPENGCYVPGIEWFSIDHWKKSPTLYYWTERIKVPRKICATQRIQVQLGHELVVNSRKHPCEFRGGCSPFWVEGQQKKTANRK